MHKSEQRARCSGGGLSHVYCCRFWNTKKHKHQWCVSIEDTNHLWGWYQHFSSQKTKQTSLYIGEEKKHAWKVVSVFLQSLADWTPQVFHEVTWYSGGSVHRLLCFFLLLILLFLPCTKPAKVSDQLPETRLVHSDSARFPHFWCSVALCDFVLCTHVVAGARPARVLLSVELLLFFGLFIIFGLLLFWQRPPL